MQIRSWMLAALATVPGAAMAISVDGSISLGEGYNTVTYQNNSTSFGDNFNELDGLFALLNGSKLNIGVTGNLSSGNAIVLYLDTQAGGNNVLNAFGGGVPSYVSGQNGMRFDAGFAPDVAIALNRFSNDVYYDIIDLVNGGGFYLGTHPISGGGTIGTGPAWFDNSNTLGVGGGTGFDNGSSASTGLELDLNLASVIPSVKMMAMLTNNGDGFSSNQVLGGLGGGYDHLAFGPGGWSGNSRIDFQNIAGDQCLLVTNVVPEPGTLLAIGAGLAGLLARRRRKS
ncbi:MAG TPA: PEP-CTERM sorting domain-containing protein [Fimbriimonadaceae bacterium]|nr:PEP-CTERM sorting domain-containing protein [Fimbriimonadaceae bacterium]